MNTPAHDDPGELRYAEYVLGVLEADERAAVEREAASSAAASAAVAFWQRRLLPLAEVVPPESPPARLVAGGAVHRAAPGSPGGDLDGRLGQRPRGGRHALRMFALTGVYHRGFSHRTFHASRPAGSCSLILSPTGRCCIRSKPQGTTTGWGDISSPGD
jgi:hypothetical protein